MFYVVYPLVEWYESRQPPFGSSSEDQYIVIRGKKPKDAEVTAYGTFLAVVKHVNHSLGVLQMERKGKEEKQIYFLNITFRKVMIAMS